MVFSVMPMLLAAPKSVKQAEKLSARFDKLDDARAKIAAVLADSSVKPDAYTYYVAGKIEENAFRHYSKLLGINRNDPNVDRTLMADALLSAMQYYEKAMTLDTVIDKKGKVSTRYSQRMAEWLNLSVPSLYNAGIAYMNKRMYYPKAYDAFRSYALAPQKHYYSHPAEFLTDSIQANAWFYAGVMAYNANQFTHALQAFEQARILSYPKKEVFLNEIICLSKLIKNDSTLSDSLSHKITLLAAEGHKRFGLKSDVFIKKYVAGLILEELTDSAITVVDSALSGYPDNYMLHAMKAGLLLNKGDLPGSVAEYRIAADHQDADFSTLKEAAKTLAKEGIAMIDMITGTKKKAREKRAQIREQYFAPALAYAMRAQNMSPDDPDLINTIETIEYYLH